MSVVIYSFSMKANGADRLRSQVRLAGNDCFLNEETQNYDVYCRDISFYDENTSPRFMAENEIGPAIEEFEENLKADVPTKGTGISSLDDLLKARRESIDSMEKKLEDKDHEAEMDRLEEETNKISDESEIPDDKPGDYAEDFSSTGITVIDDDAEEDIDDTSFEAIRMAAHKLSETKKMRILKVVQDMLSTDLVDDSEILLMLAETADLKKTLSALLSKLGVTVSLTAVSREYKTFSQTIPFSPDRVETLQTYRMGVVQALTHIENMKRADTALGEMQASFKAMEARVESEKKASALQIAEMAETMKSAISKSIPQAIFKPKYMVFWRVGDTSFYLTVKEGSPVAEPNPVQYPTKSLGFTNVQARGFKFVSKESADAQIARMKKFMSNTKIAIPSLPDNPEFVVGRIGFDVV